MPLKTKPLTLLLAAMLSSSAIAEGPPLSGNTISNKNLTDNQNIAKVQAAGSIATFMSTGAQQCDDNGKNCHSLFGNDDKPDFTSIQMMGQDIGGVSAMSFGTPGEGSSSIATQTGKLAVACGDTKPKTVAGVAIKITSCYVNSAGDAQVTFQTCTAPGRGNPIKQPDNAVPCSTDPAAPDYKAPTGKVCMRPACDSEPLDSLNGWSTAQTISWLSKLPDSASESEKTNNGLGFVFYPSLNGATPSFTADSDNMVAVKIVQSFINTTTNKTAVGLKLAFRNKKVINKDTLTQGEKTITNPREHTAQWDTIEKLQANPLVPKYAETYGQNGAECIQQVRNGLATDGKITVCDQTYNKNGIKPLAKTATVATSEQNCGTTAQCIEEVVNVNTWTETCVADVPLALKSCETIVPYTIEMREAWRVRKQELCHEKRLNAVYTCETRSTLNGCTRTNLVQQGGVDLSASAGDTNVVYLGSSPDGLTLSYRMGTIGNDYWGTGFYRRAFNISITDVSAVQTFMLKSVAFDDEMAISVNGNWVYSHYGSGQYYSSLNRWGDVYGEYGLADVPQYDSWTGEPLLDANGNPVTTKTMVNRANPTVESYPNCGTIGKDTYTCITLPNGDTASLRVAWERNTSWDIPLNMELKGYLQNGNNTIIVDVGVGGGGEGWMFYDISAYKDVCDIQTINDCAGYEAAQ